MSKHPKPYRLLSDSEIHALQQRITRNLSKWNEQYAQLALSCELRRPKQSDAKRDDFFRLTLEENAIALCSDEWVVMSYCLLGEVLDNFKGISQQFLIQCLNLILGHSSPRHDRYSPTSHGLSAKSMDPADKPWGVGTQEIDMCMEAEKFDTHQWFYPGSPALILTLRCAHYALPIALHPQWVLAALPQYAACDRPLVPLQQALSAQTVQLDVALSPVSLPLADLTGLCVGDIIQTDHLLTTPLHLTLHEYALCLVDVGETHSCKSIQIRKTQ